MNKLVSSQVWNLGQANKNFEVDQGVKNDNSHSYMSFSERRATLKALRITRRFRLDLTLAFLFCFIATYSFSQKKLQAKIDDNIISIEQEMISWRHYLHEHPELSNREYETAKYITAHLEKLGIEVQTGIAKTGVVGILKGGKPGPVIGLRADMDGLPVPERVDLPWASKARGVYNDNDVPVMHACGHDTHVAILLAVATVLTKNKQYLRGTIKFIFQPAEEGAPEGEKGGASLMVEEGVLKNPDVDVIFGLHIQSSIHVGQIMYKPGGTMASSNSFKVIIHGKQTHGSRPWSGIDPIVTAAQIINNAQTIVSRNMPLIKEAAVVSFGSIHGGVRSNIIPEKVELVGTIRALDNEMRDKIFERLTTIVTKTAESNGATAEININIEKGNPITYNDPALTAKMLPSFVKAAGKENVKLRQAITGAEDFSYFQKEIPGLYFFIGGTPVDISLDQAAPHHTPDFFVHDDAMITGLKAMCQLVLDYSTMEK